MGARSNGQAGANGTARETNSGTGIAKKRRHMRAILKDGVEAALRADPEVVENCTPRTFAGKLVRGMLIEAAKAKTTPLKEVMALLDWQPAANDATDDYVVESWDWSEDGVWETMPEPEETPKTEEPGPQDERPRQELLRRVERLIEVGDFERVARIVQAMLSGRYHEGSPAAAEPA